MHMKRTAACLLALLLLLGCAGAEEAPALPYRMVQGRVAFAFPILPGESYAEDGPDFAWRRAYFINSADGSHGYMVEIADIAPFADQVKANIGAGAPQSVAAATVIAYANGYFYPAEIADYTVETGGETADPCVTVRFSARIGSEPVLGCGILQGSVLALGLFPEDATGRAMAQAMQALPEAKARQLESQLTAPCEVRVEGVGVVFPCSVIGKEMTSEDESIRTVRYQGWLPSGEFFHFQQFTTESALVFLTKAETKLVLREIVEAALQPYEGENLRDLEYAWPAGGVYTLRGRADLTRGDAFIADFALIATRDGHAYLAWATAGERGAEFVDSLALSP